jgi:hypothetical protein
VQSGLATPLSRKRAPSRLARLCRAACVVFGIALAAYLVRGAGFARVADVVGDARAWVPVLVVLELLVIVVDAMAARTLVRGTRGASHAEGAPLSSWIRASALANACSVFLPAGRAAGEAARGATLSPSFGTSRAVAAFARLQVCSLLGTAIASLVLAALVALLATGSRALAPLLLGNAVVCAALGGGIYLVVRSALLGGFARRVLARLLPHAGSGAGAPSLRASAHAVALCTLGRAIQAIQYGVAVLAVGGAFTLASSVTSDGIHLVAASGGDLVPNQIGAMEAAYGYFAAPLGFADAPARAISIAVIMHGIEVGVALFGLVLAGVLPRTQEVVS